MNILHHLSYSFICSTGGNGLQSRRWDLSVNIMIIFDLDQLLLGTRVRYHCVPKKEATWCLENMDWFSKFFHQLIHEKICYLHITVQRFPPHLQYVATLPCEIRKSKNFTKFSHWTWQLIWLTKIHCEILCNLPQKYCNNYFT